MPTARVGRVAGGDDHHRVARADDDRAVGLLGEFAGFDGNGAGAERDFASWAVGIMNQKASGKIMRGRGRSAPVHGRRPPSFGGAYLRMPSLLISSPYRSASLRFR